MQQSDRFGYLLTDFGFTEFSFASVFRLHKHRGCKEPAKSKSIYSPLGMGK